MTSKNLGRIVHPAVLSILLAACGGGTGEGGSEAQIPDIGAANGVGSETDSESGESAAGQSVSGRVADGYIKGAMVCVDLNENEACDEGEPSSITGDGGVYTLEIPAEGASKPILADIPAAAIDEDTGEAVGRKLVFSAPADRPEFLSPITTLVQAELRSNPSLDVDGAERAVKSVLGLADEETVSLFTDYVAESTSPANNAERAGQFRYLHNTARVVASMMKDIEAAVETAAVEQGNDVTSSPETQRAIRELVRSEVRELLPQIAREVAELEAASEDTDETVSGGNQVNTLDPDRLAEELRPADVTEDVNDRIQAIRDREDIEQVPMKDLLAKGMYWLDVECYHDGPIHEMTPAGEPAFEDSFQIGDPDVQPEGPADMPGETFRECEAFYGHIQLNAAGDEVVTTEHVFDRETGLWELVSDRDNDYARDYVLVGGQWVPMADSGPNGAVTFTDDGNAILSGPTGQTRVNAAARALDNSPVVNHLWDRGAGPHWFEHVDDASLFPGESHAYRLAIREETSPYLLFNQPPRPDGDGTQCSEFGGNCNVVHAKIDDMFSAQMSLDLLRESTLNGVELIGLGDGGRPDHQTQAVLSAEITEDGGLPVTGTVDWFVGHPMGPTDEPGSLPLPDGDYMPGGEELIMPAPGETYVPGSDGSFEDGPDAVFPNPDGTMPDCVIYFEEGLYGPDLRMPPIDGQNPIVPDPDGLPPMPTEVAPTGDRGPASQDPNQPPECPTAPPFEIDSPMLVDGELNENMYPEDYEQYGPDAQPAVQSRWRLVEKQGVSMLEIALPFSLRHDEDSEDNEAVLLIEHDGFVRYGARIPNTRVDSEISYDESAFKTLQSVVESVVSQP